MLIENADTMKQVGKTLSQAFLQQVVTQSVIYLEGPLGAGKTTLVQGFLQGLGYQETVKSPTYTLVETYEINNQRICHFDCYRINDPNELEEMGIRDYVGENTFCFIEWPEKALACLPAPDFIFQLAIVEAGRQLEVRLESDKSKQVFSSGFPFSEFVTR